MAHQEEIFYVVAYDKTTKKFRSADEMIGVWTDGQGPVRVIDEAENVTWRDLEDGLEKDIDYDNTLLMGAMIQDFNRKGSFSD